MPCVAASVPGNRSHPDNRPGRPVRAIPQDSLASLGVLGGIGNLGRQGALLGRNHARRAGGAGSDLLVTAADGSKSMVEVKATGSAGFQYFYAKDCATDVLLWLSFAGAFEGTDALSPTAYWLRNPKEVFDGPRKITLTDFRRRCAGRLVERPFTPI